MARLADGAPGDAPTSTAPAPPLDAGASAGRPATPAVDRDAPPAPSCRGCPTGETSTRWSTGTCRRWSSSCRRGAEVMDAYLSGAAPVLLEQARRPLLGDDRAVDRPDRARDAAACSTSTDDLYLRHHTLGRAVSRTDPELTALAVMPLAMSIEMLAEAGACLLPDLVVTGLRDVRATRWLAVGERPTHRPAARAANRARRRRRRTRVHVSLAEIDDSGQPSPVIEGIVLLAAGSCRAAGAAADRRCTDAEPSRWAS